MSGAPVRVAFAGLAHSHPFTDAENVLARGGVVTAVHDSDAVAAAAFAERFGGTVAGTVTELVASRPDVVIATPRAGEVVPFVRAWAGVPDAARLPIFFNKVVAATRDQLSDVEAVLADLSSPIGTASVLRFAPALSEFAAAVENDEVLGVRVHVQHDNAGFQIGDRAWQDDPTAGGGTLVTVGVHAWEMIDRVFPGARFEAASGWTRRAAAATTRSEDAAGVDGLLHLPAGDLIPAHVLVGGVAAADCYSIEVLTTRGMRRLELDVDDANDALGFSGLIRALFEAAANGTVPAPWAQARVVVANTVRAAEAARANAQQEASGDLGNDAMDAHD